MYKLSCKDLGIEGDEFVADGATPEEAVQKMKEHLASAHEGSAVSDEAMKAKVTQG